MTVGTPALHLAADYADELNTLGDLFPEVVCEVLAEQIRELANHPGVDSSAALQLLEIFAEEP